MGVNVIRVHGEEVEAPFRNGEGLGGNRRRQHRPHHARFVRGIGDHVVQVFTHNGERELEGRVVGLALVEPALVTGVELERRRGRLHLRGEITLHRLRELNSGLDGRGRFGGGRQASSRSASRGPCASSAMERSATAEMVSSGLTPSGVGITEPSAT